MPEELSLQMLRGRLEAVARAHLTPQGSVLLVCLARPAIRLQRSGDAIRSHLGGDAALAQSDEWPRWNGQPLSLVALLDLEEIAPFESDPRLPARGLLNFFYDADAQQAWGFDPSHRDGWRVLLVDSGEAEPRTAPADAVTFPRIGLTPKQTLTIPGWEEPAVAPLYPPYRSVGARRPLLRRRRPRDDDTKREAFSAVQEEWDRVIDWQSVPNHQVGGWPRLQQGPIWRECQVVSQGVPLGTAAQAADPRVEELAQGAEEWRLLLQLDTDEDAGWMWGDLGTLYFAIHEAPDPAQLFREAWMVFQCG